MSRGLLYFTASDPGGVDSWLYRSDGTRQNTVQVPLVDSGSGAEGFNPRALLDVDGTLYVSAASSGDVPELWKVDESGTATLLSGQSNPDTPTDINSSVFSIAWGFGGLALFQSDGTPEGTFGVPFRTADIDPRGLPSGGIRLGDVEVVDGTLFFTTVNYDHWELWRVDRTETGAIAVRDRVLNGASPRELTVLDGKLYYVADEVSGGTPVFGSRSGGVQLWESDLATYASRMLEDFPTGGGTPLGLIATDGAVYFAANDGTHGTQLWKYAPTAEDVVMVTNVNPDTGFVQQTGPSGQFFLANIGGTVYFAADDGTHGPPGAPFGPELWKYDEAADTYQVVRSVDDGGPIAPTYMTVVDGKLFFAGWDPIHKMELWQSDGTSEGTSMVHDINPGEHPHFGNIFPGSSFPHALTAIGGTLFFGAQDENDDFQAWSLAVNSATTAAITPSTLLATSGGGATFTVTVGPAVEGSLTPTGTVAFYDSVDGGARALLGTAPLDREGRATLPAQVLPVGSHTITAEYSGNDLFAASTVQAFVQTVAALTPEALQALVTAPESGGSVTIQPGSDSAVSEAVEAVNAVTTSDPQSGPVTITLDLGGGTYTTDTHVSTQPGVTLLIANGTLIGGSPALIVDAGIVVLDHVTAVNGTDAPTILVQGGSLIVRNSTIEESTGFARAAILITGGTVDLGTAGDPGGNVINVNGAGELVHNTSGIPVSAVGTAFTIDGTPLAPSSLSGLVFEDFNGDGQVDFGEQGIAGVTITLDGADFLGNPVHFSQPTDGDGTYIFLGLSPGLYTIRETQPAGYTQGINSVGTAGGTASLDQFDLYLAAGLDALNYNLGERPAATGAVGGGQTAGIGFWNNNHGQALIRALNGGVGTQLGDWLAATFPNMFGASSGDSNLALKDNAYVASFFQSRFVLKGVKLDAQVLATALAVYVTNATLNSTGVGTQHGFLISGSGVGTATFNVGAGGEAFGVANNTVMTVMDLLLAADAQAAGGVLYSGNATRRTRANNIFGAINQAGQI